MDPSPESPPPHHFLGMLILMTKLKVIKGGKDGKGARGQ